MHYIDVNHTEYIVISFFTEGHYEKVFRDNLYPTLIDQRVSYHVECVKTKFSWGANTNIKPFFVQRMLQKYPGRTLIWLDADSRIENPPKLFDKIDDKYDMGVFYLDLDMWYQTSRHKGKRELGSGIIMLRNRPATMDVVKLWCQYVKAEPKVWEQKHLQRAVEGTPTLVKFNFPLEYSYIYSLPNGQPPHVKLDAPVIVQYQASREVRKGTVRV